MDFRKRVPLEERKNQSLKILNKFTNSIPVYVDTSYMKLQLDKPKFVTPIEFTIGHLLNLIRNKLALDKNQALFMFINNKLMSVTTTLHSVYHSEKDEDGFLYVVCNVENTFG
jgi:hypothetical protein